MSLTSPRARWQEELQPWLPGVEVHVVTETGSTNTDLMQALRQGRHAPTLLVAESQSAGRGRLGRRWQAPAGGALTFSLGLPLQCNDWSGLSLAVGVSVARSLHPGVGLKWPNDLWWQMRKLGGILIETALCGSERHAVVGIGLNLREPEVEGLSTPPAWLGEFLPGLDAAQVLDRLLVPLARDLQTFAVKGFSAFADEFARRDVLRGLGVRLSDGSVGQGAGVDASGALLVHTAAGVQVVNSSEVSVRPDPNPSPC